MINLSYCLSWLWRSRRTKNISHWWHSNSQQRILEGELKNTACTLFTKRIAPSQLLWWAVYWQWCGSSGNPYARRSQNPWRLSASDPIRHLQKIPDLDFWKNIVGHADMMEWICWYNHSIDRNTVIDTVVVDTGPGAVLTSLTWMMN
jgi:hypothetical protein